jgi:uncharacterized protein (TIGR00269 family)
MQCSKCKKPAVTFIQYSGRHLCKQHFNDFFESRVKAEVRRQGGLPPKGIIAIGVSGGKDSVVALHMIKKIAAGRPNLQIHAITVDEGVEGYRPESIPVVERNCKLLGVPLHIVKFKEITGKTMDEIAKIDSDRECAYCGVFRRLCLNTEARRIGASYLVTGHNLDDTAQSILMNFCRGDVNKLARLGPHKTVQPGLIPRLEPLRAIPEKENALYAILNGLEVHIAECPYARSAQRNQFRAIINDMELQTPGTRHAIVSSYDQILPALEGKFSTGEAAKCKKCGEPTSGKVCMACEMKERLKKK